MQMIKDSIEVTNKKLNEDEDSKGDMSESVKGNK